MADSDRSGSRYSLEPIGHDTVLEDSLRNIENETEFSQTMEAALTEICFVLYRAEECCVMLEDDSYIEADRIQIRKELEQLASEIDRIYATTEYGGFYFMASGGRTFTIPLGCPESCHNGVRLTSFAPVRFSADVTKADIREFIDRVSYFRSMLGAWQNGLEHVGNVADALLAQGSDGISFDYTVLPHVLLSDNGVYTDEFALIDYRISQLQETIENDTLSDVDLNCIKYEITVLNLCRDIIADLLCHHGTGTGFGLVSGDRELDMEAYIWEYGSGVPDGPGGEHWTKQTDAPIGTTQYYKVRITPGVTKTDGPSRNLILLCTQARVYPDWDTLQVWRNGILLEEGSDYRLYRNERTYHVDPFDPDTDAKYEAKLGAFRNHLQHMYYVYYDWGLIFSNGLMDGPDGYVPPDITVTYSGSFGADGVLSAGGMYDGSGGSINAGGVPVRIMRQACKYAVSWSEMDESVFDSYVRGDGPDTLPRFAMGESIDVDAAESTMTVPEAPDYNAKWYVVSDTVGVVCYGFDAAKLDQDGMLLDGAVFEMSREPGGSPMEFVAIPELRWTQPGQDGAPVNTYRLAVSTDGPSDRTREIHGGAASLSGLEPGTYYIREISAPSGYRKSDDEVKVYIFSYDEYGEIIGAGSDAGDSRSRMVNEALAWWGAMANLVPVQVDGDGYDITDIFPGAPNLTTGMALFRKDAETGKYSYGTLVKLQIGSDLGQVLQGTEEDPLKGGAAIVNVHEGYVMPMTGGPGIGCYSVIGLCFMGIAAALLLHKKRRA